MKKVKSKEVLEKDSTQPLIETTISDEGRIVSEIPTIWSWERKKCVIVHSKVIDLLNLWGYGQLKSDLVLRKESILSLKDTLSMWKEIYEHFMNYDEDDFLNPLCVGVEKFEGSNQFISKNDVRNALIDYGNFNKTQFLNEFTENDSVLNNPKKSHLHTPLFRDNKDEVFTFFDNGVVRTTKDGSVLQDYGITDGGYIWDNKIRTEVKNIQLVDDKGSFEEFVEKCMSVKNDDGEWVIDKKEYESFRTIYGYLLSNYTNNGETPAPMFVDRESDGVHAEGGNGKSLVMKSVKHWKKTTPINGKNVQKGDSKFTFSGVKLDTEFVFMDDVNVDFPFNIIYNFTTGDMEVERKNVDRFVIPESIKPKIGVCTNYIMNDTSHSTSRRQYVVEFSDFWNQKSKEGVSVEKFLGKRLIDKDFTDNDWIQFYNFGFRCLQEFLKKGVVQTDKSNYLRKQFISQIEGDGVNDGVVDWIENYIISNESKFREHVVWATMYDQFHNDFEFDVTENWNSTRLKTAVWEICKEKKWKYNPHKVGTTLSSKRWKTGGKGHQVDSVKIYI